MEEKDPLRFMAAFAAAAAGNGPVFLADPSWGATERATLQSLLPKPPPPPSHLPPSIPTSRLGNGWLMIPAGGTSGSLKFARHDEATIDAAVRGFCAHFQVEKVNCLGLLPLHHVSGFMAWMRSALTGGACVAAEWKRLEAGELPALPSGDWFVSLVPTQLRRLLQRPAAVEWLRGFQGDFGGRRPSPGRMTLADVRGRPSRAAHCAPVTA